jgi:hypothetical protein
MPSSLHLASCLSIESPLGPNSTTPKKNYPLLHWGLITPPVLFGFRVGNLWFPCPSSLRQRQLQCVESSEPVPRQRWERRYRNLTSKISKANANPANPAVADSAKDGRAKCCRTPLMPWSLRTFWHTSENNKQLRSNLWTKGFGSRAVWKVYDTRFCTEGKTSILVFWTIFELCPHLKQVEMPNIQRMLQIASSFKFHTCCEGAPATPGPSGFPDSEGKRCQSTGKPGTSWAASMSLLQARQVRKLATWKNLIQ